MSKDVERSVIGMLAAWLQAAGETPGAAETPGQIPADLLPALTAPLKLDSTVAVKVPAELAPSEGIWRLVEEACKQVQDAAQAHYGQVTGCLMRLFAALAREASPLVDVGEFLQCEALKLAVRDDDGDL